MLTTRDNSDFFTKYSRKTIESLYIHEPCRLFLLRLLMLKDTAAPLEVHNRLLRIDRRRLEQLITRTGNCTCPPQGAFPTSFTNTCSKNKIILLLKAYQNWGKRNNSQLSTGNYGPVF